jgi:uncharacterized MAPEG superfamily protein
MMKDSLVNFAGAILCAIASGAFTAVDAAVPAILFFLASLIFLVAFIVALAKGN